jgi:hypothetical protein
VFVINGIGPSDLDHSELEHQQRLLWRMAKAGGLVDDDWRRVALLPAFGMARFAIFAGNGRY